MLYAIRGPRRVLSDLLVGDRLLREGLEHGRPVEGRIGRHIGHAELRTFDRGWIFIADARSGIFGDARLDSGDVGDVDLINVLLRDSEKTDYEPTMILDYKGIRRYSSAFWLD